MIEGPARTLDTPAYRLFYWPFLPGRGELVRLVFEEAGVPYLDIGRLPAEAGGGIARVQEILEAEAPGLCPFAPPVLLVGRHRVAQAALICDFVAARVDLVPQDAVRRRDALQLALTLADVWAEVHATHHPIAVSRYFEEQREEAIEAATAFVRDRLPKWLAYFERVLGARVGDWTLGDTFSYVDSSLFQTVEGLRYAFPSAMAEARAPRLFALVARVRERPRIAQYLASERRLAFNEQGIFRHYPELDVV